MRSAIGLLGVLSTLGCMRAVPPIEAVALPSQTRAQAGEEPTADIVNTALAFFHLERRTTVVDDVTVTGQSAVVRLTIGPVPLEIGWVCGRSMSVPLKRDVQWQVVEAGLRERCARAGPSGLPADRQELLEAARLTFSRIHLDPVVRVVRGAALGADAIASLSAIGELLPRLQFETETMSLPANVFVVNRLERTAAGIEFAGTLGPVPRRATLACGTNWTVALQPHVDGWSFGKVSLTVC